MSYVNLANRITIFRLILIPPFLFLIGLYQPDQPWIKWAAFAVFVTAALSDVLDGFVARHFNQQSKLGKVLDPLADKLLVNLALVVLAVNEHFGEAVPLWVPVLVLTRDAGISGASFYLQKYRGPIQPKPRLLGKGATAVRCVTIAAVILQVWFDANLVIAMVVLDVLSGIDYLVYGWDIAPRKEKAA